MILVFDKCCFHVNFHGRITWHDFLLYSSQHQNMSRQANKWKTYLTSWNQCFIKCFYRQKKKKKGFFREFKSCAVFNFNFFVLFFPWGWCFQVLIFFSISFYLYSALSSYHNLKHHRQRWCTQVLNFLMFWWLKWRRCMNVNTTHVNQSLLNPYPIHYTLWTRIYGFYFLAKCLKHFFNKNLQQIYLNKTKGSCSNSLE